MNRLNRLCNYLIDWTRVGELLISGRHRYSFSEIVPRAFVIVSTLAPIVYHKSLNILSLSESMFCFMISHYIVIHHLIEKRLDMKQDCDTLIDLLKREKCSCHQMNEDQLSRVFDICYVCVRIEEIMNSEAPNSKASATWGSRKRMLLELQTKS